jgi:hypothetical protein
MTANRHFQSYPKAKARHSDEFNFYDWFIFPLFVILSKLKTIIVMKLKNLIRAVLLY